MIAITNPLVRVYRYDGTTYVATDVWVRYQQAQDHGYIFMMNDWVYQGYQLLFTSPDEMEEHNRIRRGEWEGMNQ